MTGKEELLDHISDNAEWIIPGINHYKGKAEIVERFLAPLAKQMKSMGHKEITNIVAENEYVVAESFAKNRVTIEGKPYNNIYCVVYQFENDKIIRISEYCDTSLIKETFGEAINT